MLEDSPTLSRPLKTSGNRIFGKVPLYLVMVVPLIIQVVGSVAIVGWLAHRNGQKAVNNLATQLRDEASGRIKQHLDAYLATPIQINQMNADAAELELLDLTNFRTAGTYFWRQMRTFNVGYIGFGTPQGAFVGVERTENSQLLINEKSTATNQRLLAYNTNSKGDRATVARVTPNYDPRIEAWYSDTVKAGKPVWSSIYYWEDQPDVLSIAASYPLYTRDRQLLGVLSVDHILSQTNDFLSTIKISPSGRLYILERTGNLVATSSAKEKPFQITNGKAARLSAFEAKDTLIHQSATYLKQHFGDLNAIQQNQQLDFSVNGEHQYLLVMPWKDTYGLDWLIVVAVPESDFMAQMNENTRNTILSCAIALVVAAFLGIPTSRWIAEQILHLSRASEALADGHLNQTVTTRGITELVTLAESFNRMAQQLRESFSALEKTNEMLEQRVEERTASLTAAEAELRALFAAMDDLVVVYDRHGRFQRIVSPHARLLMMSDPEQIGKTVYDVLPIAQADAILQSVQHALDTQQLSHVEFSLPSGQKNLWFAATLSPLAEDLVLFVARDITELKSNAEQLVENEKKLRTQNRVLLKLAKSSVLNQGNLQAAIQEITEAAAHTLDLSRAGVWFFEETYTKLECLDRYDRTRDVHTKGVELAIDHYPKYFSALEEEVSLISESVLSDPRFQEFIDCYLTPNGIQSVLHTAIQAGQQTVGVICLEQTDKLRQWTVEEQSFSRSLADLITLGLAAQDRKRAEEALRISQEKFAKAFSASPDFITITSLKTGHFVDVNESFLQASGFSRAEVLGKTVHELGAWVDRQEPAKLMRLLEEQGYVHDLEIELRKKSGEVIIALLSAEIIELEAEPCMLAVTKDITDRKQAEAKIRESQKKYRELVESTNSIILRVSPAGEITFLNTYGQQFFGYQDSEIIGASIFGTLLPRTDHSETELKTWIDSLSQTSKLYVDAEVEHTCRSGEKAWICWSTRLIFNEGGDLIELLSVGFDISARQRAEAALQEKEQYLRLILDNIPQQVFWKDTDLNFLGCNRNWANAAGLEVPEEIVGKTDYDLLPDRQLADQFREQDRQIITSDRPQLHIIAPKIRPLDGHTTWLDISKIPIHDANQNVIGLLGVIDDITQRKQAEEALKVEQEKSERLLLNVLPRAIAERLKQRVGLLQDWSTRALIAESFEEVTVLFADIVNFTTLSANVSAAELVGLLNRIFLVFDDLCEKHGLEKIKTIGDAYMVVGGLPDPRVDHAEAIAEMALDMQQEINQLHTHEDGKVAVRVGINTGPVIAGVIGKKKFTYDLWGDVVNTASRMESHGLAGSIQVTEATYQRLKEKYNFDQRGMIEVKGKGTMTTYWLIGKRESASDIDAW